MPEAAEEIKASLTGLTACAYTQLVQRESKQAANSGCSESNQQGEDIHYDSCVR